MRAVFALLFSLSMVLFLGPASAEEKPAVEGTLRSASFVTNDIDACVEFYTQLLGYTVLGESTITAGKSRQVVGATGERKVTRYVSMGPAGWTIENPDERAGVSFIEIEGADATPFDQDGGRASRAGELVLAHRVKNIAEIARRVEALGVPVVAPLGKSGSGKSISMAVLDPNGVRVEMYEY